MYVVYINLLYFLSIFLFTYNKNLLSQKKNFAHFAQLAIRISKDHAFRTGTTPSRTFRLI